MQTMVQYYRVVELNQNSAQRMSQTLIFLNTPSSSVILASVEGAIAGGILCPFQGAQFNRLNNRDLGSQMGHPVDNFWEKKQFCREPFQNLTRRGLRESMPGVQHYIGIYSIPQVISTQTLPPMLRHVPVSLNTVLRAAVRICDTPFGWSLGLSLSLWKTGQRPQPPHNSRHNSRNRGSCFASRAEQQIFF